MTTFNVTKNDQGHTVVDATYHQLETGVFTRDPNLQPSHPYINSTAELRLIIRKHPELVFQLTDATVIMTQHGWYKLTMIDGEYQISLSEGADQSEDGCEDAEIHKILRSTEHEESIPVTLEELRAENEAKKREEVKHKSARVEKRLREDAELNAIADERAGQKRIRVDIDDL